MDSKPKRPPPPHASEKRDEEQFAALSTIAEQVRGGESGVSNTAVQRL